MTRTLSIITAIALTACTPVYAKVPVEQCLGVKDLAETIMQKRQDGVNIGLMFAITEQLEEPASKLVGAIIEDAYGMPQFMTDEMQEPRT